MVMNKFSDLVFKETTFPLGIQSIVSYGEYELSVVKHGSSYGNVNGLYEIGVFKGDEMVELPGVTEEGDTVKGFLTEENVSGIMTKMISISGSDGIQVI